MSKIKGSKARAVRTEGKLVEVRRVAWEDERETVDFSGVCEAEREVLVEHRSAAHQRVVDSLRRLRISKCG